MTADSEHVECIKTRCTQMLLKSESKVYGMHKKIRTKKSRLELRYTLMTLKSDGMVCGMHKTSRIEL